MKVAITGGAGFIGTNLTKKLIAEGLDVNVIDDLSSGSAANAEEGGGHFIMGSILDDEKLDSVFDGVDAVVHLAARPSVPLSLKDPLASNSINVEGTLRVLEACRRKNVSHIIVASSSSVYGANPEMPKSEDLVPMPMSPYAVSKLATESYTLAYQRCFGIRSLAFRFFNVYGPYQKAGHAYAAVIPAFAESILKGNPLVIEGDGAQSRDFTFVDDVTDVISRAVKERTFSLRPINLAFGTSTTVFRLAELIAKCVDAKPKLEFAPSRLGDVRDSLANSEELLRLFPDLSPVEIEEGLQRTVSWYKSKL